MHNNNKSTQKEDVYTRIRDLFNIKDFLITDNPLKKELGVESVIYDKSTNSSGSKGEQYKLRDKYGEQRIILYDQTLGSKNSPRSFYKNFDKSDDKGDFFQFLLNRVQGSRKKAHDVLEKHDFYNQANKWRENINIEYEYFNTVTKPKAPFILTDYENLRTIHEEIKEDKKHFLNKRGIDNTTLESYPFKEKVMVYDYKDQFERIHENIFFPKYITEEIKGAEVKPVKGKGYCFGKDELLWSSNKPEIVDKVIVVESAINALSHYQLYKEENRNTWYFSTNGNFYEARIDRLFEELKENNVPMENTPLVLATDNDYDGLKYDLSIINRKLEGIDNFKLDDDFQGKRSISFESHDQRNKIEVNKYLLEKSDAIPGTRVHNEKDKIHLSYPHKDVISGIPELTRDMKKNIPFLQKLNIEFEKPEKWNDWNDVVQNKIDVKQFDNFRPIVSLIEDENPHILNKRGITNEILQNESFRNSVFVYHQKDEYKNVKEVVLYGKYKQETLIGVEVENSYKATHLGRENALWVSKQPSVVEKVVIVESAINAISHKQLNELSNHNTLYISTGGKAGKEVVEEIFKEIKDANIDLKTTIVELATDNKVWSINMELAIINKMQDQGTFRLVYDKEPNTIAYRPREGKKADEIATFFEKVKLHLNDTYRKSGENEFIKVQKEGSETHLKFPSTKKLKKISHAFTKSLIHNFSPLKNIKIRVTKPQIGEGNTINEKLKLKLGLSQNTSDSKHVSKHNYNK